MARRFHSWLLWPTIAAMPPLWLVAAVVNNRCNKKNCWRLAALLMLRLRIICHRELNIPGRRLVAVFSYVVSNSSPAAMDRNTRQMSALRIGWMSCWLDVLHLPAKRHMPALSDRVGARHTCACLCPCLCSCLCPCLCTNTHARTTFHSTCLALHRLYLGITDGMSIAQVWACRYSN